MLRRLLCVLILISATFAAYGQTVDIESVDMPDDVTRYLEDYALATSLLEYLFNNQVESHCEIYWLELMHDEEHVWVCVLENVLEGGSYLFAEIGGSSYIDKKLMLILRDGEMIHHRFWHGRDAYDAMAVLIPRMESNPGEYIVFASIEKDGEVSYTTARFMIEPTGALEE